MLINNYGGIVMKKVYKVVFATFVLFSAFLGGLNSIFAEEEKVIHVGGDADTPGWIQMSEKGEPEGFDYDIWMEIGKRTGYEIDYQIMDWDGLWASLEANKLDCVANQVAMTDERKEKFIFTEPYAYNPYVLMCAEDNEKLQTVDDIESGMTIASQPHSSDEALVAAIEKKYDVKLEQKFYDGMTAQEIALGRIDLWPRAETAAIVTVNEIDNVKILGKFGEIEINGYPFAKNERGEELASVVNKALEEMREDGTLKELSEKWFNVDITQEPEE